ncbi:MAG: hypothetical protein GY773_11480, partial [Actinomycetia bacterium]|nr:hypothetical protein [Actinomycetes bacterium]
AELGSLADLRELTLVINQISGPIPSELGILASLQFLAATWLSQEDPNWAECD